MTNTSSLSSISWLLSLQRKEKYLQNHVSKLFSKEFGEIYMSINCNTKYTKREYIDRTINHSIAFTLMLEGFLLTKRKGTTSLIIHQHQDRIQQYFYNYIYGDLFTVSSVVQFKHQVTYLYIFLRLIRIEFTILRLLSFISVL